MADDASTTTSAPQSGAAASQPTYSNNPTDPTTWSPGFAAQQAAAIAQYQASQTAEANAAALATLQPAAFLTGPGVQTQIAGLRSVAKANDTGDEDPAAQNFVAIMRTAATALSMAAQTFSVQYAKVGGTPSTT